MENKQTAVDWLMEQYDKSFGPSFSLIMNDEIKKAKEMEKEQAQNYAEFCVMCDRENLPLLDFESYVLTYGGNK
jgi:chloramphenicol O-acetyltransferase